MIRVFGVNDTDFTSNGDVVLRPFRAKVHKADNGDYYLDLETNLDYIDYLVEGNIVVCNTPQGEQGFRVNNVKKTKNKITTKCNHLFYDSNNLMVASAEITDLNCADALSTINSATTPQSPFTTSSDITAVNSYTCTRQTLNEAITALLELYGGHLVRDNFSIGIVSSIGSDNGVIVQYKKNIKDISCEENWDNVCTKILPVGKDDILLNALDETADIYINSSTQYDLPYCKTVKFTQDINRDDYLTDNAYIQALIDDLRTQATAYLSENSLPQVNYTLSANVDKITDIGDVIQVIDERLGVNLLTNVISFDYDCIAEKYTEIEFGNFKKTLSNLTDYITEKVLKSLGA